MFIRPHQRECIQNSLDKIPWTRLSGSASAMSNTQLMLTILAEALSASIQTTSSCILHPPVFAVLTGCIEYMHELY